MTPDPSRPGRDTRDTGAAAPPDRLGVADWLRLQHERVTARFPPEATAPCEAVVRDAMSGRSATAPPLRRAGWDVRYEPGAGGWRWSPADAGGRRSWEPVDVGLDPRLVDPVRSGNFLPCPFPVDAPLRERVIVRLAPGGTDVAESVEVDLARRAPVPGGLHVGPSVHQLCWDGPDALLVSRQETDGAGDARWVVERVERGAAAPHAVHAFPPDRVAAAITRSTTAARPWYLMTEWLDHRRRAYHLAREAAGPWCPVPVPQDVRVQLHGDVLLLVPRRPWTHDGVVHGPGDALVAPADDVVRGRVRPRLLHRTPRPARMQQLVPVRERVLVVEGDDDGARLLALDPRTGSAEELVRTGPATTLRASPVDVTDAPGGDRCWVETSGPLSPPTLSLLDARAHGRREVVAATAPTFDHDAFRVTRRAVAGPTGAPVPYVVVAPAGMVPDGRNPTVLSVYGGFDAHERLDYLDLTGPTWLDRRTPDGRRRVLVHAFVGRGAPRDAAPWDRLRTSVEEMLAVAAALRADGVADAAHLGATGASHGGLVAMNAVLGEPAAFGAVACRSAVLDLLDYPALDGTAWSHEYGDPRDPASAGAMAALSPVHRVVPGVAYPPVLLWTSDADDRVSPEHSRRAARRLAAAGADVLYLETPGAGHDALGTTAAGARGHAVTAAFLDRHLVPARH
ncbi:MULTISPECIES: prolyl oligopeptidase family serine peptidase [Cellulomonas]|uniref:prolyl oligopeptidase family serine peptidase n=1 Tax=Cellulomonas TaxID=1707 RepID=UPI0010A7AE92|nr:MULTISPECIES: prolyl oligopeptidase family serine peptidase [Cellulomonas]